MAPFKRLVGQLSLLLTSTLGPSLSAAQTCDTSGGGAQYHGKFKSLGCYNDSSVSILSNAKVSTVAMTPQYCADFCGARGYGYGGIEFTTYVGDEAKYTSGSADIRAGNASVDQSQTSIMRTRSTTANAIRMCH